MSYDFHKPFLCSSYFLFRLVVFKFDISIRLFLYRSYYFEFGKIQKNKETFYYSKETKHIVISKSIKNILSKIQFKNDH